MSVYSSLEVYPSKFDEVDLSSCENCMFDCDIHGYCKEDAKKDLDMHDQYLYDVLKDKGYGGAVLKLDKIKGKNWLVLYVYNDPYLLAEKLNTELGCPIVPVKTEYTMGVPGLNVSNCYTKLLEVIEYVSRREDPVDNSKIVPVERMLSYCEKEYGETVSHCRESNIVDPAGIVNVVDAFHHLGLTLIIDNTTGEVEGFLPPLELII